MNWQKTENRMVEVDDEPRPTKSEDDGGEGRQADTDLETEVRRIQELLKKSLKQDG